MSADPSNIDYAAVLADLEAKRDKLDAAIAGIRTMLGMPAGVSSAASVGSAGSNGSTEIEADTFFSLSIPDAAKKYLGMRKKPATTPEIVEALRRGGQTHAGGESFGNTLGSVLARVYGNGGGIVRVGRGMWGLAEWYPNKPRKPSAKAQKGESQDDSSPEGDDEVDPAS
ncbi:MAG: hypothetical protein H7A18_03225 [Sinobacteraceae bacterium]|nr:hypothetical protein [Anaerolineae bacterium]MCP5471083.1 hypothetical protein [Nevskiaceae bacterium]